MEEIHPNAQLYSDLRTERTENKGQPVAQEDQNAGDSKARDAAEDMRLLRKAGLGDARAFHQLVDRHAGRLFGLAYSLIGNSADAEDVVQEALAGAYKGISGFEGRSSVGTWLTRILVLQAAKWRRDQSRPAEKAVGESLSSFPAGGKLGSESGAAAVERRLDLQAAMNELSPEHKQVLVLREFEGHSYEEIAQLLGVPRGTVESRLHRARGELRNKLKEYLT
jgi:RNA polymerase sigma-70 factor (ECF subfamily)